MRSSPDRQGLALAALAFAALALGLVAELERFAWADTRSWVPDLLVGWSLAGFGIAAFALGRPRLAAALLYVAGVAWFFGNFYSAGPSWLAWLSAHLSWLFLAPLIQLNLAYPTGRPRSGLATVAVASAWIAAVLPWVDWDDDLTLALSMVAVAVVAAFESTRGREPTRSFVVSLLLVAWAVAVPRLPTVHGWILEALVFDLGVLVVGIVLFTGLRSPTELGERALELDEAAGTLRGALAGLLHDPELQLAFAGSPAPVAASGRRVTELADASGLVGVVVHDVNVLTAREDRAALVMPVALAAERDRLQAELRRRADEVAESAARLIRAEDDERSRLAARLAARTGRQLGEASRLVIAARERAGGAGRLGASVDRVLQQLERAREEVASFAAGLGSPALENGLSAALSELVEGLPLEVETRIEDVECSGEVATTIWFVCSEGVANVLKHAAASRLAIEVAAEHEVVRVVVADDGRGGADPDGFGLSGLRDRVAAHGGALRMEPGRLGGSALVATLPQRAG